MSTSLVLKECPYCSLTNLPLSRILFLHCGHNVCIECITKCGSKCPECRKRIVAGTPHRIYLSVEQLAQQDDIVIAGAPEDQPQKPPPNIPGHQGGKSLITRYEETCQINEQLLEETRKLRHQIQKLNRDSEAKSLELKEKDATIVRYQNAYKRKKEEKAELEVLKEADEKKIHLLNAKIKALVRNTKDKSSRRRSSGGDTSLQVEPKAEVENILDDLEEPPTRRVKRRKDSSAQ